MGKGKKDKGKKKAKKLSGEFTPAPKYIDALAGEVTNALFTEAWRKKQDAEVAAQWAHHSAKLMPKDYGIQALSEPEADGIDGIDEASKHHEAENRMFDNALKPERSELPVGKPDPMPSTAPETLLEPPADPVLENGNGQPVIHYLDPLTGKEKVKGYTRVTTYIDVLDDKTVLNKWKLRTLLEGAALEFEQDSSGDGGSIAAIGRALHRLDADLADIDRRESLESELLGLRRAELIADHRKYLDALSENLLDIGGAHDKAIKGTNLHRLTEIVDNGGELPADTNASDRRDVEAYTAKMLELGIETLWTERRVVLDDIQVSGTMDRAYLVKLPGQARRIRVVGDLKTGGVGWGQGKIGMQLALYSKGLGYDWAKPLERTPLRLSKAYGLLVHLPQGEGVCEVYVVDLELATRGLDLAAKVREFRNTGKRVYDLKAPLKLLEG